MSLFENDQYRWKETYFVLFDEKQRPAAKAVKETLKKLGERFQISDVQADGKGRLESLTMLCPYDYAAMDISYVAGEDVLEQVQELKGEMRLCDESERPKLDLLLKCNARLDIYHFAQVIPGSEEEDDDDEFVDPGALLSVLENLARLCHGVGIDPQSGVLM